MIGEINESIIFPLAKREKKKERKKNLISN